MWLPYIQKRRVYLDYAAATPLSPRARRAMVPYEMGQFANPSAIHSEGMAARTAVEQARETVARTLGVQPAHITWTGSGTEANNLALLGTIRALQSEDPSARPHIITTATEHPSIHSVLQAYEAEGGLVTYLPVNASGLVSIPALTDALRPETALVSIAYANSETGVVQPLRAIHRAIRSYATATGVPIRFHTDASQAPLWLPCSLESLGVDMMTLDAAKCHGPKGCGVLAHRRGELRAVLHGGSQENGLRPGTENVSAVVGGAVAIAEAQAGYTELARRVTCVRDAAIDLLTKHDNVVLNGDQTERLANNINISIPGVDTEYATIALDAAGFACATKSACSGADGGGSSVVFAMTGNRARADATLRISLSPTTTIRDIKRFRDALYAHIALMDSWRTSGN